MEKWKSRTGEQWDRPSPFVVCHTLVALAGGTRGMGNRRQKTIVCSTATGILPYNTRNMKNARALFTLCLSCLLLSAQPASEPALRGFSAASSRVERDWELKYAAIPLPKNVGDYMQRLAARPHHLGSP